MSMLEPYYLVGEAFDMVMKTLLAQGDL